MRIEKPIEAVSAPMADSADRREELILRLHTKEVALLLDIFEAALPTEKISGLHSHNPALTHFFNSVYGGLITTARDHGWGGP
ncbi:MAG: hypothetical protein ACKOYH_00630 [Cyanobium sp.]